MPRYACASEVYGSVFGGPSPSFFSDTVADYIANGMTGLKPSVSSVPDPEVQSKIAKVCIKFK